MAAASHDVPMHLHLAALPPRSRRRGDVLPAAHATSSPSQRLVANVPAAVASPCHPGPASSPLELSYAGESWSGAETGNARLGGFARRSWHSTAGRGSAHLSAATFLHPGEPGEELSALRQPHRRCRARRPSPRQTGKLRASPALPTARQPS